MSKYKDTIFALSTPTGKSAIALIRLSGENSLSILKKISSIKKIIPKKTRLTFLKFEKKIIDEVIVTYFKQPKSFTGEEMVEINCHGSPAIISKKEVSIVTSLPGTTTDTVTSVIDIDGYKFTFIDTAGLRKHKGKIEEIGIKKTKDAILNSSLSLVFLEKKEYKKYKNIKNKIFIRSKADKRRKKKKEKNLLNISSITGEGVDSLLKKIKKSLIKSNKNEPILSRERHIIIMKKILIELKSIKSSENLDIQAFKYREALRLSLEINQRFDIENILDIIFNDFCIGK